VRGRCLGIPVPQHHGVELHHINRKRSAHHLFFYLIFLHPIKFFFLFSHFGAKTMASKNVDGTAAEYQGEKHELHEVHTVDEKYATGNVRQVQAASVALAAATAAQKPSLLSKNMLKLYFIMAVGYLVSTMNGFGRSFTL
jgi:hypothetical protein